MIAKQDLSNSYCRRNISLSFQFRAEIADKSNPVGKHTYEVYLFTDEAGRREGEREMRERTSVHSAMVDVRRSENDFQNVGSCLPPCKQSLFLLLHRVVLQTHQPRAFW